MNTQASLLRIALGTALLPVALIAIAGGARAQNQQQDQQQVQQQQIQQPQADAESEADAAYALATPDDRAIPPQDDDSVQPAAPIDEAALANALAADPLASSVKAKTPRLPGNVYGNTDFNWNKTSNADGSAAYTVNKPIPAPWDAKIGADINVAPPSPTDYRALKTTTAMVPDQGTGRAWANVAVPNLATVELQALPQPDRDTIGTKLQRSVPIGQQVSLTLQGTFDVTEQRMASAGGVPAMSSGLPGRSSAQIFDSDKSVQLDIRGTGTTLLAGATSVTGDPVMHNRFSAAQKVYGPLSVTGAISDVGQPTVNKSLSAGLNFNW